MVSHMRGKIADMDAIVELCDKYDVPIEDAARSIGVWNGKHGHHGRIAAIVSVVQDARIRARGFLITNDPGWAAVACTLALTKPCT